MKQVKQLRKMAKKAAKQATRAADSDQANDHLNLAYAFRAQAEILKKQKHKRENKKK